MEKIMTKTILQINKESRDTVLAAHPDAYYDIRLGAVVYMDKSNDLNFTVHVLAYGKTCNCAWYNAAEEIMSVQ
jgi:hypothetical protein